MSRRIARCSRCRRDVPRQGVTWPEGFVCKRCFQSVTRIHGICPSCKENRLLPGLIDEQPACTDCADLGQDFRCTRCGEEDEHQRKGLCARCCLRDDLEIVLDDGTGSIRAELLPFRDALCNQRNPRSATIWMRNPDVQRLLRGLADGELAIDHATFDSATSRQTAKHLRELLINCGVLPHRDRHILAFELWLDNTLPNYSLESRQMLHRFANWHHLRRMRLDVDAGTLKPGSANTARQQITVAGQFLSHLEDREIRLQNARQRHLDAWLAEGPSTRYEARNFVVWATRNRLLPPLRVPRRTASTAPIIAQDERLKLLAMLLDPEPTSRLLPAAPLVGVLLLLYAQPVSRILQLGLDDVSETPEGTSLRLGHHPSVLPAPVAALLNEHLNSGRNVNTAANANSPWLFPGYAPGQPLNASTTMRMLREAGVHIRGGRNSALRQLVQDMPPAVAAQALGYSASVAEGHARRAGSTYINYAASKAAQISRTAKS